MQELPYKNQATKALSFADAAKSLKSSASVKNVKKSVEAYLACCGLREQSEALLFGSASVASFDPKLDLKLLTAAEILMPTIRHLQAEARAALIRFIKAL